MKLIVFHTTSSHLVAFRDAAALDEYLEAVEAGEAEQLIPHSVREVEDPEVISRLEEAGQVY